MVKGYGSNCFANWTMLTMPSCSTGWVDIPHVSCWATHWGRHTKDVWPRARMAGETLKSQQLQQSWEGHRIWMSSTHHNDLISVGEWLMITIQPDIKILPAYDPLVEAFYRGELTGSDKRGILCAGVIHSITPTRVTMTWPVDAS